MTERSTVTERLQIGVEATPGTAVAANRRIRSFRLAPSPKMDTSKHRAAGQKWPTFVVPGKESMEYSIDGIASYTELVYLLSSLVDAATGSTPTGATNARDWTFTPDVSGLDAAKTLTIEQGQSARAHRSTFGMVTELGFDISRESVALSGRVIAQEIDDGITLTASPSDITEAPVIPAEVCVYLDDTSGGLGGTKLTRAPAVKWNVGDRFAPVWALDCAQSSFVDRVEGEPSGSVELTMAADSTGMALVDDLRAGATKFLRIEATGPDDSIETGFANKLTIDTAVKAEAFQELGDMDGLFVCRFGFAIVSDTSWGKAFEITARNDLTAL